MSDETPWGHLQRLFAEKKCFEDALPALQAHGLNGDDVGVLFNNPTSELFAWLRAGSPVASVQLDPVDPPADAVLPPRRTGKRGLLGWLGGANAIEGLGLFTEADSFQLHGVQFAVMPEPLRPVAFGELVPVRVLAVNCKEEPRQLSVELEAEPGVVQSPRRYSLSLEPGVISLAVLPVRVCPSSSAVVRIVPVFDVENDRSPQSWRFSARAYARPNELLQLLAGASLIAAAAGLTPIALRPRGTADEGSPDPIRLKSDLSKTVMAGSQAASLWRLQRLR